MTKKSEKKPKNCIGRYFLYKEITDHQNILCRLLKDLSLLKTCAGGKKTLDNTTAEDKHRLVPVLGTPESLSGQHKRCTQVPRSHLEPDTTTERGCITASVREKKTKTQSSGTRYTRTLTETPRRSQPLPLTPWARGACTPSLSVARRWPAQAPEGQGCARRGGRDSDSLRQMVVSPHFYKRITVIHTHRKVAQDFKIPTTEVLLTLTLCPK